jgi:hypothetical protein
MSYCTRAACAESKKTGFVVPIEVSLVELRSVSPFAARSIANSPFTQLLMSSSGVITGILSHIPREVLIEILKHLEDEDRLCLALTCRRFLSFLHQLSTEIPLSVRIPSVVAHRNLTNIDRDQIARCSNMRKLMLRLAPLDSAGRRSPKFGLCYDCWRFRPRDRNYWQNRGGGILPQHWYHFVDRWNQFSRESCSSRNLLLCPECQSVAHMRQAKTKNEGDALWWRLWQAGELPYTFRI